MSSDNDYSFFQLPESCLIDKTIFKKDILENFTATKNSDKKLFSESIEKISWKFCLRPDTIRIPAFVNTVYEYPEIEIIEVKLLKDKGLSRIAEIIMRAIPYPMLLIFRLQDMWQFWCCHQQINQQDKSKNTLEEFIKTQWINGDDGIFEKLNVKNMRSSNYFLLYSDFIDVLSLDSASKEGAVLSTGSDARELLKKLKEIDEAYSHLSAQMKEEEMFNNKMEIHVKMMELKKKRKELINSENEILKESEQNGI